jgi:hypothetical protein
MLPHYHVETGGTVFPERYDIVLHLTKVNISTPSASPFFKAFPQLTASFFQFAENDAV